LIINLVSKIELLVQQNMPKHTPAQFTKIVKIIKKYDFYISKVTNKGMFIAKDNGPLVLIHNGTKCKHDIRREIKKLYNLEIPELK